MLSLSALVPLALLVLLVPLTLLVPLALLVLLVPLALLVLLVPLALLVLLVPLALLALSLSALVPLVPLVLSLSALVPLVLVLLVLLVPLVRPARPMPAAADRAARLSAWTCYGDGSRKRYGDGSRKRYGDGSRKRYGDGSRKRYGDGSRRVILSGRPKTQAGRLPPGYGDWLEANHCHCQTGLLPTAATPLCQPVHAERASMCSARVRGSGDSVLPAVCQALPLSIRG